MERLGLVAVTGSRSWRLYAGPIALLLVATAAVGLLRGQIGAPHTAAASKRVAVKHVHAGPHPRAPKRVYVVRAGDTLGEIAARSGITLDRLVSLNPKASPTALFIGEKLNLR
jgi:Tfp pilus assembly protein FimV